MGHNFQEVLVHALDKFEDNEKEFHESPRANLIPPAY